MVLKYLINNLTDEEKKIYKEAFYAVDYNHNGFILPLELKRTYDLMEINITIDQINYLFNILPQNKNLGMGYSEFIMAGVDQKKLFTEENLEDSFNYFYLQEKITIYYINYSYFSKKIFMKSSLLILLYFSSFLISLFIILATSLIIEIISSE